MTDVALMQQGRLLKWHLGNMLLPSYVFLEVCVVLFEAIISADYESAMTLTCFMLTLIHKRHRLQHYRDIREYYIEQLR